MNNRLAQISILINGVLVIAVGVLFWLHFSSPSTTTAEADDKDSVVVKPDLPEIRSVNGAIAYVDIDKVLEKYAFVKDRQKQLETQLAADEKKLQKQKEELEAKYMKAQQDANTMTELQMQITSDDITRMKMKLDEDYAAYEKKSMYLTEQLNKEWLTKIDDYLKGLSKEKNYSYVITYVKGSYSAVVYANDSLNITDQLLTGLNAEYKKGKK